MADRSNASSKSRVKRHRESLRRRGLRPIQIWVPDTRSPEFKAEAARQARLLAASPHEQEIMDWLERVGVLNDDDAPAG